MYRLSSEYRGRISTDLQEMNDHLSRLASRREKFPLDLAPLKSTQRTKALDTELLQPNEILHEIWIVEIVAVNRTNAERIPSARRGFAD